MAIRRALTHVDDLVEDLLGDRPTARSAPAPLSLDEARRVLTLGWGSSWAGRYDQLGSMLPQTILRSRVAVPAVPVDQQSEARDIAALDVLLAIESFAADWMHYQPTPRLIVRTLRERAGNPTRLTGLAQHLGVARPSGHGFPWSDHPIEIAATWSSAATAPRRAESANCESVSDADGQRSGALARNLVRAPNRR